MCSSPARRWRRAARRSRHHVPEVQGDRAGEAVRVGEVGEVLARAGALPVPDHAHRRRAARRVAREHVAAAGAVHRQQAAAVGVAPLELGRVLAVVGDHRLPALLLVPAEGGHVVVAAQQQPGLAGAGLRGEVALPGNDAMGSLLEPAGHVRGVAFAKRLAQDRLRQSVDLEQDHPRDLGAVGLAHATRPAANDPQLAGVVVEAERRGQQHQRDRHHEGRRDRPQERRRGPVDHLDRDRHHGGTQHEGAEPEGEHGQREHHANHQRPEQGVDQGDQRGGQQRRAEARHVDPRDETDRGPEDQCDQDPEDEAADRDPGRAAQAPRAACQLACSWADCSLKYSSAVRVLVCCSPDRLTPRSLR